MEVVTVVEAVVVALMEVMLVTGVMVIVEVVGDVEIDWIYIYIDMFMLLLYPQQDVELTQMYVLLVDPGRRYWSYKVVVMLES